MRLGIVSDTHGQVSHTQPAIRLLDSLDVREIIHCGDIGSVEIIPLFAAWPTHFVFGNVDYNRGELRLAIEAAGQQWHEPLGTIEREGRRIAFLHSDDARLFRQTVESGEWDVVCYGHTHVAAQTKHGPTLVVNPGAIYRANPHSFAVIDLPEMEVNLITI